MTSLAKYVVQLEAQSAQYVAELQKANASLGQFHEQQTRMLGSVTSAFRELHGVLGLIGIRLGVRFFENWISSALDVKKLTEEQTEQFKNAIGAINDFKKASDDVARSLGTFLAPAIETAASALGRFAATFTDLKSAPVDQQIRAEEQLIEIIKRGAGGVDDFSGAFHELTKSQLADIEALKTHIEYLKRVQEQMKVPFKEPPKGFVGPVQEEPLGDIKVDKGSLAALLKMPSFNLAPAFGKAGSAPPLLAKPGTGGEFNALTGVDQFGSQKALEQAVIDDKMKREGDYTKFYEAELLKRQRADIDAWSEQMKLDQKAAENRLSLASTVTSGLANLLTSYVATHQNASKSVIALQRAAALASIGIDTASAVMRAFATLPPPASYAAAAFAIATGAAQALAVTSASSGYYSGASFGSSAVISSNPPAALATPTGQGAPKTAVQIFFQGDVFGWDATMQKRIVDSLRDVIDNKDVVIIGPNSRQALVLGGG